MIDRHTARKCSNGRWEVVCIKLNIWIKNLTASQAIQTAAKLNNAMVGV